MKHAGEEESKKCSWHRGELTKTCMRAARRQKGRELGQTQAKTVEQKP